MEKKCFKCLRILPLDAFYKHAAMSDGHLNKCKECTKKDATEHRLKNLSRIRQYDKLRGAMPHRVAAKKEYMQTAAGKRAHARALKKQRELHPDRYKAKNIVNNALRDGKLKPFPCFECGQKAEAHHPDYSRPLSVVWLCSKHHKEAHKIVKDAA